MTPLEQLLLVQEHDSALDQLRHRKATLPERAAISRAEALIRELAAPLAEARGDRDVVARDVRRLEDEAEATAAKVIEVDKAMYSGSITSPRELQAMQADIEQLRRHQRALEDRELDLMERQETLDAAFAGLEAQITAAETEITNSRASLAAGEAEIDAAAAVESGARIAKAAELSADLLARYDRCRAQAGGIGAARLVGNTCQGCRLTIPSTEVERIRKADADAMPEYCDNCGAILVPSR